ncbi:enoyl-[acyl-carrier-protein] reductase FabI [Latilactobacillus curvatus]|nr:enoyl-ACP reductase FabI [Latilactobacillus curvatus]MCS8581525.1 enoyl-[acyl-carrier-protein] reductase FabI [Latilactobacillus curvatus]MCS8605352.1 enoyl-[acyl-carrier-protein] reductase FabI [Latilactobacillus curvatus]MCS8616938.1 enoyl-[acyl-carrier-protein] reductase FabI [Latilactobacillus curvatus]
MFTVLNGKKILVMGVANQKSIAWGCAQAITAAGGEVIYTYQNDRIKTSLQKFLPASALLVECDVSDDAAIEQTFATIQAQVGKLDGIVHAIAYANREELDGTVYTASRAGYLLAQEISAYSLIAVAKFGRALLNPNDSIVTMTYFGSERAVPNYNVMGIAKASLEASVRYLARDLGPDQIRVNAISAGAIKTLAVTGVKGYRDLLMESENRTVDGQSVTTEEVGNVASFLLSPLASGMTGDVIYVDKGVHLQ